MTYAVSAWAKRQQVKPAAKGLLMVIATYSDADGQCFPGQDRLAAESGLSVRQVRRHLDYLQEVGVLDREARYDGRGKRTSDIFRLQTDVDYRTSEAALPDTEGTHYRTSKVVLPDTSVRVTTSKNNQKTNPQEEQVPSGTDLHRYFVKGLVLSIKAKDSGFDGQVQPKREVAAAFSRLLRSGDSPADIRWLVDAYCAAPANWYGEIRWKDFFNAKTQARLRRNLRSGNSRTLVLVTEAVSDDDPYAGLSRDEAIAKIRWDGMSDLQRAAELARRELA